ncbi:TetR family transcriptional regulator [Arenicella chitinivorans]|uniref:TetR family transcriptional regulator n=1 Tax=Arenicella chitinivorans TaxID=1329800 RepID=A0A918S3Z6_9GAMM|nr:TetR/AcrR family transcriptional regulator [Arenicella chitinivorans]GHA20283.1 TetR family transcriptional regulator [Arenicella chitinivorans]
MTVLDTRERLLDVALNLIWQSNYNSVGVNEICKRAGVTKGSFYHHFESKGELFAEATSYYITSMKPQMDAIMSPTNPPLEQLEQTIAFIMENKFGKDLDDIPGCAFLSAGTQCEKSMDQINDALQSMAHTGICYNTALARSLADGGYLEDDVDVEKAARSLHQLVQGALIFAKVHRCPKQVQEDIPEAFYRLLGLKKEYWYSRQKAAS